MSKAFTKEDDDAGFALTPEATSLAIGAGPFRITATGARRAADRPELARAELLAPVLAPTRATLGVTVHVRDEDDRERTYRLVSAAEHALLGEGCSVEGPIGRALLGAEIGEVREISLPGRDPEELEIVSLEGEEP